MLATHICSTNFANDWLSTVGYRGHRPPRLLKQAGAMSRRILRLVLPCLLVGIVLPSADAQAVDSVGVWPLQPQPDVVDGFDPPDSEFGSGHRGADLAGSVGRSVRTALPGQVAFVGVIAGRGVVVVSHGATRTTYEPVSGLVSVGEQVSAGQVIGRLQLIGSHCFPSACLHWGWLRGEVYLDPLLLVGVRRVRLLPLTGPVEVAPSALRPRVGLLVGPPQPIRRDVRIELGRGEGGVPQHFLYRPQIRSPL